MMTVFVGDILNATAAPVSAGPTSSRTWQWFRSGTAIPAATTTSYRVTEADINAALTVRQGESNFMGSAFAMSDPTATVGAWSPSALFALAEPGVWYDPSDLTTLFQDTAGTTPVTTPGQTVALALDKSKGLVLGPELVTNGDFSAGSTGWSFGANITISGGVATYSAFDVLSTTATSTISNGKYYLIEFDQGGTGTANPLLRFGQNSTNTHSFTSANGRKRLLFEAGGVVDQVIRFRYNGTGTLTLDNITIKELPGFHATQATAASRPTYGIVPATGRRNLLTYSEQFDNAAWAKIQASVTANAGTAPDGTMTADILTPNTAAARHFVNSGSLFTPYVLSVYAKANVGSLNLWLGDSAIGPYSYFNLSNGTIAGGFGSATISDAGNGWYRCSLTVSAGVTSANTAWIGASVGTNATAAANGTDNILIWGAQLETGSTATAYQRVGSAFDVTEAGVASLSYLSFDGVDDFLVTPTITPGVDKAQVFAGVRKLSDAAQATIAEHSINSGSTAGSWGLFASAYAAGAAAYAANLNGSQRTSFDASTFTSPITNVLTSTFDIAGAARADEIGFRVNGVVPTLTGGGNVNAGTGNFTAQVIYIGRRGGTVLPFNGQIFSLIVRFGTNLSTSVINRAEYFVGQKTGVDIARWTSPTIFARDDTAVLDRFNDTIERRAV